MLVTQARRASLVASPKRASVFTDTSKLYDELLADMILCLLWARTASPPGPDPGHKSPLSSVPPCLSSLPKCDGMALLCLVCLPYKYCMTMYYSIGPPIHRWPGLPPWTIWALKTHYGDIRQRRTPLAVPNWEVVDTLWGVLHCSMSPQGFF